ncbi:MAG TPA: DedA family protein [Gemmatimonadaceae bacterium]|nr:DedA family protein [Gemmatimonadaceae bacterium]
MDAVLAWLGSLPPAALYVILAVVAATENFFPPIPADVIVAFGAFLAAREHRSPIPTIIAVVIGNVGGAVAMFAMGRRFGAEWIRRRLSVMGEGAEQRVRDWYGRFGLPALFLSRFLPAVRAVVPPLAGAIRVPATGAIIAIASASTLWYTLLAVLAYRLGTNWSRVTAAIGQFQRTAAIIAGAVVLVGLAAWWIVRRRKRA